MRRLYVLPVPWKKNFRTVRWGTLKEKGFGWVGGIFLVKEKVSHLAWLSSSVLLVLTRSARLIFGAPKFEPSIRLIYRSKQPKICPANTVNKQTKISTSFWTNLRLRWPSAPAFCRSTSSLLSWLLQHPLVRHTLGEEAQNNRFYSFSYFFLWFWVCESLICIQKHLKQWS